ncbi:MAG: M48 family metallopeptidase [bacterium]|nr:M48 family metallopeptidase [bacterium]
MYSHIAANKRKTWILIGTFVAVILALGYAYDAVMGRGAGIGGVGIAGIIAITMGLGSYYKGDRVALWSSGAKEVQKRDAPALYRMVENLAITSGMPVPRVHIIHDPAINAFATGRDPQHASVAVTTGAIERLEPQELEGVLAHELSHVKNYDIRVMTVVIVLAGTIALLSDFLLRAHWFAGNRRDRESGQAGLILLVVGVVLAILAPLAAELIKLAVSRKREYLADADGALLTRYPEGLARALEKIAASNQPMLRANGATAHLFIANPFGARRQRFMHLFSTHPPAEERVRALRGMAM